MTHHIIRRIRLAHCKRGPALCAQCQEMDVERICLLDIDPPHLGEMQRRVIEVRQAGQSTWREFDIMRTFESQGEAQAYADQHGIVDVQF